MQLNSNQLIIRVIPFNDSCESSLRGLGIHLTLDQSAYAKAFNYERVFDNLVEADDDYLPDMILLNEERLPTAYDRSIFERIARRKDTVHLVLHRRNTDRYKNWARDLFSKHQISESTELSLGKTDQLCRQLSLAHSFQKESEYHRKLDEYYKDKQGVDIFLEEKLELLHKDQAFFKDLTHPINENSSYEEFKYEALIEEFDLKNDIKVLAQHHELFNALIVQLAKKLFK